MEGLSPLLRPENSNKESVAENVHARSGIFTWNEWGFQLVNCHLDECDGGDCQWKRFQTVQDMNAIDLISENEFCEWVKKILIHEMKSLSKSTRIYMSKFIIGFL